MSPFDTLLLKSTSIFGGTFSNICHKTMKEEFWSHVVGTLELL